MSSNTFNCPICFKTDSKEEMLRLTNCAHYLCWTCSAKLMRTSGTVSLKCPLCRSREIAVGTANDSETEEEDSEYIENDEPEMSAIIEDISENKTTYLNNSFTNRFNNCKFYFNNKPNE